MAEPASGKTDRGVLSALLTDAIEPCLVYPERLVWPNSWVAHIPFAFWLIGALEPKVVVELGVHSGNSYGALCQGLQMAGCSASCFGVDTWEGDDQAGFYGDQVFEDLQNWHDARYSGFSRLVRSTFDSAVSHFAAGSIDLLHIDGLHTYDAVKHDFETWRRQLSNRAVVLFHDTNVRDRDFGVWRFWAELSGQYPAFEFLHGHGLGVLGVGADLPTGLAAVFEAARDPTSVRRIRGFFSRLGDPLMRDVLLGAARADLCRAADSEQVVRRTSDELRAALDAARAEQSRAEDAEQIARMTELASEQDRAIAESEVKVARLVDEVSSLGQRIAEQGDHLRRSDDLASQRGEAIAQFERDLRERRSSIFYKPFRETMRIERQLRGLFRNRPAAVGQSAPKARPTAPAEEPALPFAVVNPLKISTRRIELAESENAELPTAGVAKPLRIVLCLSHVAPWPPRAGNEYRTHRLLTWFRQTGWEVVLLYCPLPGEEPSEAQLVELYDVYDNVVLVGRDGLIRHRLACADAASAVTGLEGKRTPDVAELVGETAASPTARLLSQIRTYCPDVLVEAMLALDDALSPSVVLANYVFMTRGLPLLRSGALKIVDTIDVFSTKASQVVQFGIEDSLAMSQPEEGALLAQADLVLAIQPNEARALRKIAPGARVLTVGVDMSVLPTSPPPQASILLMVASGNAMNAKGLRDFLRFAWPQIREAVPEAELQVVGSVGEVAPGQEPGVRRLGRIPDLAPIYAASRLVINPAVAGTGLKIKTLEALAHLRPIVLWPSGVDGVADELRELCVCVSDWFAFAQAAIRLLRDDHAQQRIMESRDRIAEILSTPGVFAELDLALRHRADVTAYEPASRAAAKRVQRS